MQAARACNKLRYIEAMFEVLAYVYENYWSGEDCPQWEHLERKLNHAGFEPDEIASALTWLSDLDIAATGTRGTTGGGISMDRNSVPPLSVDQATSLAANRVTSPSTASMRIYSTAEQTHLGRESLGFVCFLEAQGVLPADMREIAIDRAMAAPGNPLALDDLKIIVLMVFWSFGKEPDALVLDELCDDASDRIGH